jgi:hypothetical protein
MKRISLIMFLFLTFVAKTFSQAPLCTPVSSLVINTGYNPVTGIAIVSGQRDPNWIVTAMSPAMQSDPLDVCSPVPQSAIVTSNGDGTIVPLAPPNSGYISCLSNRIQQTTIGKIYTMTVTRNFTTCVADNININMQIAVDNTIDLITIDGVAQTFTPPSPTSYKFANYNFSVQLSAGNHTIAIVAENTTSGTAYPNGSIIANGFGLIVVGTISSATGFNSLPGTSCTTNTCPSPANAQCSDVCFWKVTGNNIIGGRNIFGTLTNDNVVIQSNSVNRGIITASGNFGWNTQTPTKLFDVNGQASIKDLPTAAANDRIVFANAIGDLESLSSTGNINQYLSGNGTWQTVPSTGNVTSSCTTQFFVPKVSTAGSSDLTCSQIYDNGTAVGINTTDPTYAGRAGSKFTINQVDNQTAIAFGNATTPRFALNGNTNGSWSMFDYASNAFTIGITQSSGNVGIGTTTPTAQLHTTAGVRFAGLPSSANTNFVVADASGNLSYRSILTLGTGNTTNNCSNVNTVLKLTGTNTIGCSLLSDNGTSVGINTTNYNYSGLTVVGPTGAPITGIAALAVNGVTMSLAYFATSDERMKKNIQDISNALDKVKAMNGKTYQWNTDKFKDRGMDNNRQYGFIAQDLMKVLPEAVVKKDDGYYAVNYNEVIPVLTEAIKEQQKQIDDLKALVNKLVNAKDTLTQAPGNKVNIELSDEDAIMLGQNIPNPFNSSATIAFSIPSSVVTATINFTTVEGKALKTVNIPQRGNGVINVYANNLAAETYFYSLIIDGNLYETKRMEVLK